VEPKNLGIQEINIVWNTRRKQGWGGRVRPKVRIILWISLLTYMLYRDPKPLTPKYL
jgi:hypothetical protein